jgi:hypothetical protein
MTPVGPPVARSGWEHEHRRHRLSPALIALVALAAMRPAPGGASACETMTRADKAACAAACGCCQAEGTPARRPDRPAGVERTTSPRRGGVCRGPVRGLRVPAHQPAAPERKPERGAERGRPDPGGRAASAPTGPALASRPTAASIRPNGRRAKSPLYLRTSRLLI